MRWTLVVVLIPRASWSHIIKLIMLTHTQTDGHRWPHTVYKKHTYPGRILQEKLRHGKVRRLFRYRDAEAREAMIVAVAFRPEAEP